MRSSFGFTVTFSEAVAGVDAADFTLTKTGTVTGSVASVSGSGATYTVSVGSVAGDGTLRLDIDDDDSIVDVVGNPLGGGGAHDYTGGQAYTIDNTPPSVISINRTDSDPTNASSVGFAIAFSETVTGSRYGRFHNLCDRHGARQCRFRFGKRRILCGHSR